MPQFTRNPPELPIVLRHFGVAEAVDSESVRHHIEITANMRREKLMRRAERVCAFWWVLGLLLVAVPAMGQGDWEPVVGDTAMMGNGFGDLDNEAAGAMAVFDGRLYVVAGGDSGQACQLWRTANGVDWEHVLPDGFGDANNQGSAAMIEFDGYLYVGTSNLNGAQIHRSDDGVAWSAVVVDGLWNVDNRAITVFAEHAGELFAGTENETDGGEIWRTGNGTNWSFPLIGGFGDVSNRAIASLASFDGMLYAGTFRESPLYNQPGDIFWTDDLQTWFQNATDPFADPYNVAMSAMSVHDGMLYVGTTQLNPILGSGCEVWRTDGGMWTIAAVNGFGSSLSMGILRFEEYFGELYAAVAQPDPDLVPGGTGAKIMRFVAPLNWSAEVPDGFGDTDNWAIGSMAAFNGTFYAGTVNTSEGCEVWRNDIVFFDGFESGDTGGWSGSLP